MSSSLTTITDEALIAFDTLTERAADQFPNNYQGLAAGLLEQLKTQLPPSEVGKILDGVAQAMAERAMLPDAPLETRLDHAVAYLQQHGYTASWSHNGEGVILSVSKSF